MVKKLFFIITFMLCIVSSIFAECINKKDGLIILASHEGGGAKINVEHAINASVNGHTLTVVFSENLGQVAVEVTTATGSPVDATLTITPNGIQFYIPLAGDYIVTFTLPDGDEYYGEFTVTD